MINLKIEDLNTNWERIIKCLCEDDLVNLTIANDDVNICLNCLDIQCDMISDNVEDEQIGDKIEENRYKKYGFLVIEEMMHGLSKNRYYCDLTSASNYYKTRKKKVDNVFLVKFEILEDE